MPLSDFHSPSSAQSSKRARSNPSGWRACRSETPRRRPRPARASASRLHTGTKRRGMTPCALCTRGHACGWSTRDSPSPFWGAGDLNSIRYWMYGFSVVISKYRMLPSPCQSTRGKEVGSSEVFLQNIYIYINAPSNITVVCRAPIPKAQLCCFGFCFF